MRHRLADFPPSPRRSRRVGVRGLLAVAVCWGALGMGIAGPAVAHDALIGSDPAQDAVLTEPPAQVVLTFAAAQAGVGSEVVVTDEAGTVWSDGPAQVVDTTVTQPLTADLPNGEYRVTWRSVAGDGHPVTGAFSFTVAAPTGEPSESASGAASEGPAPTVEPTQTETAAASSVVDGGAGPAPWIGLAAGVVVALVLGGILLRRRGSHD